MMSKIRGTVPVVSLVVGVGLACGFGGGRFGRAQAAAASAPAAASVPAPVLAIAPAPAAAAPGATARGSLPIVDPSGAGWTERPGSGVTNLYSQEMLLRCVRDGDAEGLSIDLAREAVLLDGSAIDTAKVEGTIWTAPWPLAGSATEWDACQFRSGAAIHAGKGLANVARLANDDDAGWIERGQIVIRLQLTLVQEGEDRDLGTYEFLTGFARDGGIYRRALTVTEGPFVANIDSETPGSVLLAFRTDAVAPIRVFVREAPPRPGAAAGREQVLDGPAALRHEVTLQGLRPDTPYLYRIEAGGWTSTEYRFRTAPRTGEGTTRFAYAGDSRMGPGGGARAFMGVNSLVFPQELNAAWRMGVRFWLHGGDLVSGYTSAPEDFRAQLRAYKWVATPFLREIPIYNAVGNHDALVRFFAGPEKQSIGLDRWPYATESSEAIFADELAQPDNGPVPSDPRRPPYRRTVYTVTYGPTRVIVVNNAYWVSRDPVRFGGAPEGFLFPDQLEWLRSELARADADPGVRHVFLCVHEPLFPNSAHLGDGMWYRGDLARRAAVVPAAGGDPVPEPAGVVEIRNEVVRLAAESRKTVAILSSDEHNYSRMLLTAETPAGDPARDDPDGDGKLNPESISPLPGLRRPIWLIISGGAGAPHYAEEPSPWNTWWKANADRCRQPAGCYRFSPLNHWILFEDDGTKVSLRCFTPGGDLIDDVDDLVDALR